MTNHEVNEFMQRFLDDDLSEDELEALMEHIRQTPASALVFERLQQLDSELEQLPKVVPPMSIVDSILPRLELAGLVDTPPVHNVTPIGRRATLRERVNVRLLGGVVAAGVVLTLFLSSLGPQMSFDTADEDVASTSSMNTRMNSSDNAVTMKAEAFAEPKAAIADQKPAVSETLDAAPIFESAESAPMAPSESDHSALVMNDAVEAETPWIDKGVGSRLGVAEVGASSSEEPSMNKVQEVAAEEGQESNESMFTTERVPQAVTVASPDEQLTGTVSTVAEGGQQITIMDHSGNQVYMSAVYQGTLSELTWSPDSAQLHFEVIQDNVPTVHMTIHVVEQIEGVKLVE